MNLFVVDQDPVIAAKSLCNKHIVKMCSETANMLLWPFKLSGHRLPLSQSGKEVGLSHQNHPASVWIRESSSNYEWAVEHLRALLKEKEFRYNSKHYAENYFYFIFNNFKKLEWNSNNFTRFAGCFGQWKEQVEKDSQDRVSQYRTFYCLDKQKFARWPSLEKIPEWWPHKSVDFVDKNFKNSIYSK